MHLRQLGVLRQLGYPPLVCQGDTPIDFISDLSSWPSVLKEVDGFFRADGSFEAIILFHDGLCLFMGTNFIAKNTLINL